VVIKVAGIIAICAGLAKACISLAPTAESLGPGISALSALLVILACITAFAVTRWRSAVRESLHLRRRNGRLEQRVNELRAQLDIRDAPDSQGEAVSAPSVIYEESDK
jgi:hypothetical protein